jgi:lipoprotein-anchoring transpeptidase ErfK/SrfK
VAQPVRPLPRRATTRVIRPLVVIALATTTLIGCSNTAKSATTRPRAATTTPPTTTTTPPTTTTAPLPAGESYVATTKGDIPSFATPSLAPTGSVPATWYGGVSALPVIARQPGWDEVRLATRPNESVAWVRAKDVALSTTSYHIVINLTTRQLLLFHLNQPMLTAPAGVGTATDPTPTGQFFLTLYAAAPSSGYGPFVVVTSAHSDAITDWEQSGDAIIAIHGPLGEDAQIGTTGANISHGCIRLHDSDLTLLADIPPGTPIAITA